MVAPFTDTHGEPAVRGFLHVPDAASGDGIVLSHGAGSNSQSKVLVAMADALSESGFEVLTIDLPFRQERPHGPPFPSSASKDRDGIRRALLLLRSRVKGRIFVGGHSYGGRQTTILVSEEPQLAEGLLLLSYPLHPPGKPNQLRTSHFAKLTRPAFFVHGTRDPFGSIDEMRSALELISGSHTLMQVEGGHDLLAKKRSCDFHSQIAREFQLFIDGLKTE